MVRQVSITKLAQKQLRKVPPQVLDALHYWVELVRRQGLLEVRKIPGYHDEPISKGPHAGQRSIRLGRSWRAFYVVRRGGGVELAEVQEVNKHRYDR